MAFVLNKNKSLIKDGVCVCMFAKKPTRSQAKDYCYLCFTYYLPAYCFALSSSYTTACVLIINNKRHRAEDDDVQYEQMKTLFL